MAPLGLIYFAWREATERRREDSLSPDAGDTLQQSPSAAGL
jgi:hypothetical protein